MDDQFQSVSQGHIGFIIGTNIGMFQDGNAVFRGCRVVGTCITAIKFYLGTKVQFGTTVAYGMFGKVASV
jgi:hypothetical protein